MTATDEDYEDQEAYSGRPSKSRQKRECAALEDLGEALIALPRERLNRFELPAELLEAVTLAQSIAGSHSAFKRQRKYIGKLLRGIDVEPIREQLDGLENKSASAIHQQHRIERWRDRLLAGDDQAINALVAEHPTADRQKLRKLIRDAAREREMEAPPRSARLLFKYVREILDGGAEQDSA